MMRKYCCIIFFLTVYLPAFGQERINTDRPDQTESATLTPKHYFQAEFGLHAEYIDADDYYFALPEALFKYGVSYRLEFQCGSQFVSSYHHTSSSTENSAGLMPIGVGLRVGLWDQKKLLPKTSIIARVGFPFTASKSLQPDHVLAVILLPMQHDITDKVGLSYNLGIYWDGYSTTPRFLYSISFGFNLGKRWDGFIEEFGADQKDYSALNSIDAGIGFYINNSMKLDAYYGSRLSKMADRNFFGLGYSFRINTRKKSQDTSSQF